MTINQQPDIAPHSTPLCAVLVAAGRGSRLGGPLPKQFEILGAEPLFRVSLRKLAAAPGMLAVALVLPSDGSFNDADVSGCAPGGAHGVGRGGSSGGAAAILKVAGGARRQDSVAAGIAALIRGGYLEGPGARGAVLVHDAARPFFPADRLAGLAARARESGGAIFAAPVYDTVKRADAGGVITATLPREGLWLAQTPQAFRAELAADMLAALAGPAELTDEASALEFLRVSVVVVESPSTNFKITRPEDLARARRMWAELGPASPFSF